MAHELQLIKQSSGILIPATPETSDILQSKIKLGAVLVAKSTWTEIYLPHWLVMRSCFIKLDSSALIAVTRSRSQQKATNYVQSLAKPN
ncbi:DUF1367 family protein [Salmonella enterica]|nr:DUF1367 family protein [Salmonella enterica]